MSATLGLGLAALGRPGYINTSHAEDLGADRSVETMQRRCHAVLDRAWALGLRHVDCARSYGRAEEFLASWIGDRELTVSSKWGYSYTADWRVEADRHEVKDHSLATFRRQLAESRALLGRHLAIYQIHSATLESGVLEDAAVLDELAELRALGIRPGLSVSGPAQAAVIDRALAIERAGRPLFESVQATWNLLERSAEPALARAHAAGLTVIVKEALANGRLAERATEALGAALSRPWASVVLSGAATIAQLEQGAAARDARFDPTVLDRVRPEPPDEYWRKRAALPWQ